MEVELHPEADAELAKLLRRSPDEHRAMLTAITKLMAMGADLPYPHSTDVQDTKLRELRPRGGSSPWRAFYWRVGDVLRIGAIGPEANQNKRGFTRAVNLAIKRLEAS